MTTVRSRVRDGFVEIAGPGVTAVVEVPERHAEALANAASQGLVQLLDLLCSRGLLVMPAFGIVRTDGGRVRVLLRGTVALEVDGRTLTAEDREPWRDVDVEDAGDEVTLVTPEPEPVRGWRRPSRLAAAGAPGTSAGSAVPTSASVGSAAPAAAVPAGAPVTLDASMRGDPQAGDPEPGPEPEPDPEPEPAPAVPPADLTLPPPEDAPSGSAPADRVPPSPPPATGIIDSVPWRRPGGSPPPPPAPAGPRTERFDTPVPPVPAASPAASPATPATAPPPADDPEPLATPAPAEESFPAPEATPRPDRGEGRTDGRTDAPDTPVADVTTARGALPRNDDDLDRPVVLAVLCPAGHQSAPHAGRCRTCGREIPPQQPTPIPRPSLGVLRISTGGVVPLDRGVLLGRAPRVNEELPPNQRPHLIRVGGVDRDISRNHAEVVLEGWHVLVRDLGSTNGTTVALPGEEPVRLRPTEDQGIEPGSVITLADEVSLTYEVDG